MHNHFCNISTERKLPISSSSINHFRLKEHVTISLRCTLTSRDLCPYSSAGKKMAHIWAGFLDKPVYTIFRFQQFWLEEHLTEATSLGHDRNPEMTHEYFHNFLREDYKYKKLERLPCLATGNPTASKNNFYLYSFYIAHILYNQTEYEENWQNSKPIL